MFNKIKDKKGFTLVEMLIVVAIIAILVVIAIPIFNAQLDKAKEAVDDANERTATSLAMAQYYLEGGITGDETTKTFAFKMSKDSELSLIVDDNGEARDATASDFADEINGNKGYNQADEKEDTKDIKAGNGYIIVTIDDEGEAEPTWDNIPTEE